MKKRDILNEIQSIKLRSEFNSRIDYNSRLSDIEYAIKEFTEYNGAFSHELLKYIPISTVACFEAFFNSAIKEIIDFGKPFSDNVSNYNQSKNIKLDFDIVAAIQTKTLTVGEFVAHLLPYNSLEDVNSNLSTLINKDFLTELKNFKKESIFDHVNQVSVSFQQNVSGIIQSVKNTYELRHIFCHEFATNIEIDANIILMNFQNCKIFLNHCNCFIWELLYPDSPESQAEMNQASYDEQEKHESLLEELLEQINTASSGEYLQSFDKPIFQEALEQWKTFRSTFARCRALPHEGGTIFPLIYSGSMTAITKNMIEFLSAEFAISLRRASSANLTNL